VTNTRWKGILLSLTGICTIVVGAAAGESISARAVPTPVSPQVAIVAGQVIHTVVRSYERHASEQVTAGPLHADRSVLFPETTESETWVVAGNNDQIARAVTYRRNASGAQQEVTVVDDQGQIVSFNTLTNEARTTKLSAPGHVSQAGGRSTTLQAVLAKNLSATQTPGVDGDAATVVVEISRGSAASLGGTQGTSISQGNGLSLDGLNAQKVARRLEFTRQTGLLRRDATYAIDGAGKETVVRSEDWNLNEIVDHARVPAGVLNPTLPQPTTGQGVFTAVPLKHFALAETDTAVPFPLYVPSSWQQDAAKVTVSYGIGAPANAGIVSLPYQGLDFAVSRGEAAQVSYQTNDLSRDVTLREGKVDTFATSLRHGLPFWNHADAIIVNIGNVSVSGWYLVGNPVTIASSPGSSAAQQVPGPTYILLPDLGGTAVLITASGYQKIDLLALAATLQRTA